MAVPSYTEDLTDINTAEAITNWAEATAAGWTDGGTPTADADYPFIQGSFSISQTCTKAGIASLLYNNGAGITLPTDGAYFIWQNFSSPGSMDTLAGSGMRAIVGSSLSAFKWWTVGGNNFGRMPYGGWQNFAVNTTVAADATVGAPSATEQFIGCAIDVTVGIGKGNPHQVDVLRYGRGSSIFEFGEAANYCVFSGFAAQNDNSANRWGLIQAIPGGYLWKGKMTLGTSGNAVDFRDSNVNIFIDDTRKVTTNFNTIEVNNASSRVDWTNVIITALGTVSPGRLVCNANADLNWDSCQFVGMGTFSFGGSASTCLDCIFRGCGQITQAGATITGCSIVSNTASSNVISTIATIGLITNTSFISGGTGHAIEITGVAANITLTDLTFTGYAGTDGSTGNEAIFINIASGSMNLTVDGGTVPSIRTAGCVVTVIAGAVTVEVTVLDSSAVAIQNARVLLTAEAGGPFPSNATVTISNSGTTATVTHNSHGMATNDQVMISGASHNANNGVFTITVINSNSYSYTMGSAPGSSPTGTIKAWFVALYGLTDVSGYLSTSRVYASDQPISGRVRKSTNAPYYRSFAVSGTVDSTAGFSATLQLILDQ